MDIRHEIRRLVPAGALGLLGLGPFGVEAFGEADLTVLFTDLDDYTRLTEQLGDEAAREVLMEHDRLVRAAVAAGGGREIKHTGDGIMACFASAWRGIQAAVRIQQAAARLNRAGSLRAPLRIAIGLNTGAPIVDHGDLFGTAVNVAARITDCGDGGQVLVSDVVRQLAAGKGFEFRHFDTRLLDGISDAVPLFEVVWQEEDRPGEPELLDVS